MAILRNVGESSVGINNARFVHRMFFGPDSTLCPCLSRGRDKIAFSSSDTCPTYADVGERHSVGNYTLILTSKPIRSLGFHLLGFSYGSEVALPSRHRSPQGSQPSSVASGALTIEQSVWRQPMTFFNLYHSVATFPCIASYKAETKILASLRAVSW